MDLLTFYSIQGGGGQNNNNEILLFKVAGRELVAQEQRRGHRNMDQRMDYFLREHLKA